MSLDEKSGDWSYMFKIFQDWNWEDKWELSSAYMSCKSELKLCQVLFMVINPVLLLDCAVFKKIQGGDSLKDPVIFSGGLILFGIMKTCT